MNQFRLPSRHLEEAVGQFSRLPGVGSKTALRFVLHLLKQDKLQAEAFGNSIVELVNNIKYCKVCNSLGDSDTCPICSNPERDRHTICVVESIRDVMAIENTHQYYGVYHVLGGIISPMNGIGPSQLTVGLLEKRLEEGGVTEVILALSTTMEGDTTNYYLYKKLNRFDVAVSSIARGVAIGDELEYADELTLGRSIVNRTPFDGQSRG